MKLSTKEKIIKEAIRSFNKQSYGVVSLHELAQKLDISRGNLTYHFKDKESLLQTISTEMWAKIESERQTSRQFPSFENLHHEVQLLYKIQKEYAFIFLDTHVLKHPLIRKQFRKMTLQSIEDNKATIAFSIKTKNMKPEPINGLYNNIAFTTWMLSFYWLSQETIRGTKSGEDAEKMIWSLLLPHFTNKGINAFKTFFGEAYFNNIGDAFNTDLNALISF